MALDRWIALLLLGLCLAYGYGAYFTMDADMPPFMQRNPIWPSTFPKVLAALGVVFSLYILLGLEKADETIGEIDYRRLTDYNLGQAILLLGLMVAYALLLRPLGFLPSTALFLILGSFILGERRWGIMLPVGGVTAVAVWYLVQEVLGIFMRPLPLFLG